MELSRGIRHRSYRIVAAPVTAKRGRPCNVAAEGVSIIRAELKNTLLQLVAYSPTTSQQRASSVRFPSRSERTSTQVNHHRPIGMSTLDNENSILANIQIQLIQNVMLSRYFTAAGMVVVLYDTILTIEDEVSGIYSYTGIQVELTLYRFAWFGQGLSQLRSYFTTSTGTGRLHP